MRVDDSKFDPVEELVQKHVITNNNPADFVSDVMDLRNKSRREDIDTIKTYMKDLGDWSKDITIKDVFQSPDQPDPLGEPPQEDNSLESMFKQYWNRGD